MTEVSALTIERTLYSSLLLQSFGFVDLLLSSVGVFNAERILGSKVESNSAMVIGIPFSTSQVYDADYRELLLFDHDERFG